jgi:hypothetical protein
VCESSVCVRVCVFVLIPWSVVVQYPSRQSNHHSILIIVSVLVDEKRSTSVSF